MHTSVFYSYKKGDLLHDYRGYFRKNSGFITDFQKFSKITVFKAGFRKFRLL